MGCVCSGVRSQDAAGFLGVLLKVGHLWLLAVAGTVSLPPPLKLGTIWSPSTFYSRVFCFTNTSLKFTRIVLKLFVCLNHN